MGAPPIVFYGEVELPAFVTKSVEIAIIIEVENLLALGWTLAGKQVGQIITIEMNLDRKSVV